MMSVPVAEDVRDLSELFTPDPAGYRRVVVAQAPGFKVLHLSLAPGQQLAAHRHPGRSVLVQGLAGTTTVTLDGRALSLGPQMLLGFSGHRLVALDNSGPDASAALITLIRDAAGKDAM